MMNISSEMRNKIKRGMVFSIMVLMLIFALFIFLNNQADVEDSFLIEAIMEPSEASVKMFVQIDSQGREAHLRLENTSTSHLYSSGYVFNLYVNDGERWKPVPFEEPPAFSLIALHLRPHSYYEQIIDLHRIFGDLPAGEYRLVKHVSRRTSGPTLSEPLPYTEWEWDRDIEIAVRFILE